MNVFYSDPNDDPYGNKANGRRQILSLVVLATICLLMWVAIILRCFGVIT
jgi:hypothetical protein